MGIKCSTKDKRSIKMLYENGIMAEWVRDLNHGTKIVVEGYYNLIDYYPITGEWVERKGMGLSQQRKGFSLKKLIKYINNA